jgi:hypothetical protein
MALSVDLMRKWQPAAAIRLSINDSLMLVCILDEFLCVTVAFFSFSGNLITETFSLLRLAANQFPYFPLHFASEFFCSTFDLILVHRSPSFI